VTEKNEIISAIRRGGFPQAVRQQTIAAADKNFHVGFRRGSTRIHARWAKFDGPFDFIPAVQSQFEKAQHPEIGTFAEG